MNRKTTSYLCLLALVALSSVLTPRLTVLDCGERLSQETVASQDMIDRFARWRGREPVAVAADATYGNGEFVQWLTEGESLLIYALGIAFTERTAPSMALSASPTNRRATAIAAPQANSLTMWD